MPIFFKGRGNPTPKQYQAHHQVLVLGYPTKFCFQLCKETITEVKINNLSLRFK